MRTRTALAVAIVALGVMPARGAFHLAVIDEVKSGAGGDPDVQYVEIRMLSGGQNRVQDSRLTVFQCDETPPSVLLLVPTDVDNSGSGTRWIMATASTIGGVPADFTWDPAVDGSIPTDCGMVCWGAPGAGLPPNPSSWDATDPGNYVDCVAWGAYPGTSPILAPPSVGTPTTLTPGHATLSLTRTGTSSNNAADFALACPSPTNNDGSTGNFGACSTTTSSTTSTSTTTTTTSISTTSSTAATTSTSTTSTTTTSTSTSTTSSSTSSSSSTTSTSTSTSTTLPPPVSGGKPKGDCLGEWRVTGASGGKPVVRCTQGDASCDLSDAGGCDFDLYVCFNNDADPLYAGKCTASSITTFRVRGKGGVSAIAATVAADLQGTLAGNAVTFSPPVTTSRCSGPVRFAVPLKTRRGRPVKGSAKITGVTRSTKTDTDVLTLVCVP